MKTITLRMIFAVCLSLLAGTASNTNAQKGELVVQMGHSISVLSVSFSSDGRTLASGSGDQIKLWDVETGKELRTLKGHSPDVSSVSFSSDGRTLASGSDDKTIKLWDVESGKELKTLKGHSSYVYSVAFSSDGKTLASGSDDRTIKLWDVESGKPLGTLKGHSDTVFFSVAFSPDGKTLASGSDDDTIKLWDVESGKELKTLKGHSSYIYSVAFSSDGKTLASGSDDDTIKLWDLETRTELRTLTGHSFSVKSVSFSSDGKTLASGSADKTIKLWDVESGKDLKTLTGHSSDVLSVSFSSDGRTLASGSNDVTIKLWDVKTEGELRTLAGHSFFVESVSFSSDGKTLASVSDDETISLWDVESGTVLRAFTVHSSDVKSVSLSPDGKTLASISDDKTIKLWDVKSEKELRTLTGHSDYVFSVSFSSDGSTLASGSKDKTIKTWDVESGKGLSTLKGHSSSVSSVAFSADGKTLASVSQDQIKLWDVESEKELRTLTGHSSDVFSVSFSPDGKTLAGGSWDKTIKLWDVESGKGSRTLTGHSHYVSSVSFSSDGKTLASGSLDKTIKLWDVETGKESNTFTGHSDYVYSVAFSLDGKTLASGSRDSKTNIWDVATGKEICSLIALDDNDWAVTTPNGRFDTNKIEDSQGLHWVVSDDPLKPVPLEIFMRDYYEPQLFPRLIKCNKLNNCDREFKPVRDISKLNRVQPPVKISTVSLPDAEGYVNVTVELGKGEGKYRVDGRESFRTTGVYDVRLFRDGQMVGGWPGDGAEKLLQRMSKNNESNGQLTGEQRFLDELREWQEATEVKPNDKVKIDQKTGTMTLPPFRVKLPRGRDVSQIEFSAYGFNEDRVKSQTAKWEWSTDAIAKLPKAQPVKPRAYIIAVGVNAYENPDFDLEFAADDARKMSEVMEAKLTATGQYEKVVPVTLISDHETRDGRKTTTLKQATKDNFRTVLELLAGKNVDRKLLGGVKNANPLQRATPDDLVLIMYSSHGYADRAGNFYFIPYDTGPGKGKVFTRSVRRHSISSDELSLWLRDVDAGEMIMIVDACHSAAAIEGSDFKPGPMGSRGLGQLSYDKGMRILTATQSDNIALENNLIKQGLLTYALLRDGIEARQADYKPKDNVINIGEWLAYGVQRVPKLYEEVRAGAVQSFGRTASEQSKLVVVRRDGIRSSGRKELEQELVESNSTPAIQQPSLFDFARKRGEAVLSVSN